MKVPGVVSRVASAFKVPDKPVGRIVRRVQSFLGGSGWNGWWHGGSYDAGRYDEPELQEDQPYTTSADSAFLPGSWTIRARSRDACRNNPIAKGAVSLMVSKVVGKGLMVQPDVDADALGIEPRAASEFERAAARVFEDWSKEAGDVERERTFGQLQAVAYRTILEGGDVAAVRRQQPHPKTGLATCFQLIEPERIVDRVTDMHTVQFPTDPTFVRGGVERVTATGEVLALLIARQHPGESWTGYYADKVERYPVRDSMGDRRIKLLFEPERSPQSRGVPFLSTILKPLKQLDRYTDAELMAAVLAARPSLFVESDDPEYGPLNRVEGTQSPQGTAATYARPGDVRLENGLVLRMKPGEKVHSPTPGRPNSRAFADFIATVIQQIAMALNIPTEVLMRKFNSSYSASRAALMEAQEEFQARREWFAGAFCQWCYEQVVTEAVARGQLEAPGFWDMRDAWLRASWTGGVLAQLDPTKEIEGVRGQLAIGATTFDRAARTLTGTSFERNIRQQARERELAAELGVPLEVTKTASPSEPKREGVEDE